VERAQTLVEGKEKKANSKLGRTHEAQQQPQSRQLVWFRNLLIFIVLLQIRPALLTKEKKRAAA
jgi:hypothetical protein